MKNNSKKKPTEGRNKLEFCAINLVTHPHSPEKYITLFKKALRNRNLGKIDRNTSALITSVYETSENVGKWKTQPLEGEICKFMNIDTDADWFNVDTNKIAKDKEKSSISIPENLKPNSQRFSFIFFPDIHILFVEIKDRKYRTSPNIVTKAFESIFSYSNTKRGFKKISITAMPEKGKVEEALNLKTLERLEYKVTRPNPDHVPLDEDEFLADMNDQEIEEYTKNIVVQKGGSLNLKDREKDIARIASRNGFVKAKGRDTLGRKTTINTKSHPWTMEKRYNNNLQTSWSVILGSITEALKDLFPNKYDK